MKKTIKEERMKEMAWYWNTPCPFCDEMFTKRGLKRHIGMKHKKGGKMIKGYELRWEIKVGVNGKNRNEALGQIDKVRKELKKALEKVERPISFSYQGSIYKEKEQNEEG